MPHLRGLFAAVGPFPAFPGAGIPRGGWSKQLQPFEEESVPSVASAL